MIINIRGTSGSGKTHLVRRVMELYGQKLNFRLKDEKRKQPLGYIMQRKDGGRPLFIPGHYETACGGCDTITEMDRIFNLVRDASGKGLDVLFEGLLISADVNRTAQLHLDGYPLTVIALNTPFEECLASINSRRAQKATSLGKEPPPPVPEKNTKSKFTGVQQSMRRLEAQGVRAGFSSRDEAFEKIRELLHV